MDFRDYIRALRRSWLVIVIAPLVGLAVALVVLAVLPKEYQATSSIVLLANAPDTIPAAQQGSQMAIEGAPTAAAVIDSPLVLSSVSRTLDAEMSTDELVSVVSALPRLGTPIIDITVTTSSPRSAADIANRAANVARDIVPKVLVGQSAAVGGPIVVETLRAASAPDEPSSPDTQGTLAIGLLVGLALGIALAIIRFTFDTRVREVRDLRGHGVPVLAVLPKRSRSDGSGLVMRDQPSSTTAGALRALRTSVGAIGRLQRPSYVVSPVTTGTDAAWIVAELGWSLADSGQRTVVADLDLNRPTLGALIGVDVDAKPATPSGSGAPGDLVVSPTDHPRLFVASARGGGEPGAIDPFGSQTLSATVEDLERRFDHVILKAPPILAHTEALIAGRFVGGVVVVVRVDHDSRSAVTAAFQALENVGIEPSGIVLETTRTRRGVDLDSGWIRRLRRRRFAQPAAIEALVPGEEPRIDEPVR